MTEASLSNSKYSFSGHETFPFRYAWLMKGVRLTGAYSDLFVRDDAIVLLGVGKNMVTAIRHWCDTLGLIERDPSRPSGHMRVTKLGEALFGSKGYDPYLENPATLWLLHWKLTSRKDKASTWYLALTKWNTEAFSREKLTDWIWRTAQESGTASATRASIQRDVEVFIRTYVTPTSRRDVPLEDTFECPLVELGLIEELEHGIYVFVRDRRATLPVGVFLYALLDYWGAIAPGQRTISFESILHGPGSPGAAFKLSESGLAERLEHLPEWSALQYDDTAGMRVVLSRYDVSSPQLFEVLAHIYAQPQTPTPNGGWNG